MDIQSIADIQNLARQGFTDWRLHGNVTVRQQNDLLIFNYNTEAQYDAGWNYFEQVSRGLILNRRTGEIVARPFDKFFNWFEGGRRASGHIVVVTEKMDGSLGILYRDGGEYRIATRGSFDSDQAIWATQFLQAYFDLRDLPDDLTLLFEIVYPGNRIVVDYGQREDLILLAARNRITGDYLPFYPDLMQLAEQHGFSVPKVYAFNNITEILAQTGMIDANQEGWVVEFSDGSRYKFKGDRYREMHKLVTGLSFHSVLGAMQNNALHTLLDAIPDEFLSETKIWIAHIQSKLDAMKAEIAAAFETAPKENRKDFALWVHTHHKALASYLFALLDGKEIEPLIYKQVNFQPPDSV